MPDLPTQKPFQGTAVELNAAFEVFHRPIHFGQALQNCWDIQATFHHHRPRTDLGSRLLPTFAPFLYRNAGGVGKSENVTVRQRTRKTLAPQAVRLWPARYCCKGDPVADGGGA